jgi:ubiquinone/menaquinone biosynthesis C-methylase UbiE
MTASRNPGGNDRPNTYVVNNRDEEELNRLRGQDRMLTASMGGVLPEQTDPEALRRVLDIGCGSGSWVVEAAQKYPEMSLVGIDISKRMVDYAQIFAEQQQVADRVEFQVMDALLMLEFASGSFDLVNLRLGLSFMRTWDWPKMLEEMVRVTRPGGVIRLTDTTIVHTGNGPNFTKLQETLIRPLFQAGHLFDSDADGLLKHLARLLRQHVGPQVQERKYEFIYKPGDPEYQTFVRDVSRIFQSLRPFMKKWGGEVEGYDELYAGAIEEMQRPDFYSRWGMLTAWAVVPDAR